MSRFKWRPASRYLHRLEGNGVETVWASRGDRVKIMAPCPSQPGISGRARSLRGAVKPMALLLATASALTGTAVTADALRPAIAAGLAEIDETGLRFRHPLMRSAIYQTASVSQRRAAHAALAGLLDRHPDRRAWHRAAAVLGPDEQVAADLEAAAVRAERRGAVVMAVDAFRRAAQLSEDAPSRGRRLQRAAIKAFDSGYPELGEDLLREAETLDLEADLRTWVAYARETFSGGAWSGATMVESFVGLAERMRATGHTGTALDALLSIAMRCYWGNPSAQTRAAVIAAAEKLPVPDTDPGLLLILASADPVRLGALVNARVEGMRPDDTDPAALYFAGVVAGTVWSWDRSLPLLEALASTACAGKGAWVCLSRR